MSILKCTKGDADILSVTRPLRLAQKVLSYFTEISASIKNKEKRLAEIQVLKKHIFDYFKTKDVYADYRKCGYSKKFLEEHRQDILLHKAAKNVFDELHLKKLPKVKDLSAEYAEILADKKKLYGIILIPSKEINLTPLLLKK